MARESKDVGGVISLSSYCAQMDLKAFFLGINKVTELANYSNSGSSE